MAWKQKIDGIQPHPNETPMTVYVVNAVTTYHHFKQYGFHYEPRLLPTIPHTCHTLNLAQLDSATSAVALCQGVNFLGALAEPQQKQARHPWHPWHLGVRNWYPTVTLVLKLVNGHRWENSPVSSGTQHFWKAKGSRKSP